MSSTVFLIIGLSGMHMSLTSIWQTHFSLGARWMGSSSLPRWICGQQTKDAIMLRRCDTSMLVITLSTTSCVEGSLCQIAKLLVLVRRCARRERETESSHGDSKRWVRHEKGESEMERCDTCAKNLFGTLEPCVYVHAYEKYANVTVHALCAEKCACNNRVYVHHPVVPYPKKTLPRKFCQEK